MKKYKGILFIIVLYIFCQFFARKYLLDILLCFEIIAIFKELSKCNRVRNFCNLILQQLNLSLLTGKGVPIGTFRLYYERMEEQFDKLKSYQLSSLSFGLLVFATLMGSVDSQVFYTRSTLFSVLAILVAGFYPCFVAKRVFTAEDIIGTMRRAVGADFADIDLDFFKRVLLEVNTELEALKNTFCDIVLLLVLILLLR